MKKKRIRIPELTEQERRAVQKAHQRSFLLWLRDVAPEFFEPEDNRRKTR